MKAAGSNERALIRRLFLRRRAHDEGVEVANGDDASVHTLPEGMALAVSCDAALAGSHWPRGFDLEQAAERAVQAAFSDLAAMGASARWCWSTLMAADAAALTALGRGVRAGCGRIGAVLVGGDCVRSRVNGVSLTVAGLLPTGSAMRRDAARPGERLWLFGTVGMAAAGLRLWQQGARGDPWVAAFARPRARMEEGVALRRVGVRCCIDLSDGLLLDATAIAEASGVGLSITVEALPQLDALTARFPDEALALAAGGGEDYALLCTAPPALDRALRALGGVRIGEVTEGRGVTLLRHGRPLPPPSSCGFDHFA